MLLSEAMLQQTQVATARPYFLRFIQQFPTLQTLAAADEQQVLRLWQGLGYYSRARNLLAAARMIDEQFGGEVPNDLAAILSLKGVGRYTAGAIASIAFDQPVPLVDGNVARVLCRLDCIQDDPRDRETIERLWQRAAQLVPRDRPGDFNQALMELGALVCIPRAPRCLLCPLKRDCKAFAAGLQNQIPAPRKTSLVPLLRRWTFCIARGDRWLIEQRPSRGRWASMWQFVTIEPTSRRPTKSTLRKSLALDVENLKRLGAKSHGLTHRRYEFEIFHCELADAAPGQDHAPRRWVSADALSGYPLPGPHAWIARELLSGHRSKNVRQRDR